MINNKEVEDFFAPGGLLQNNFPQFEIRDSQLTLASKITRALNDKRFLIAEAGTGIGKTLSYLVPVMLWAGKEKKPVIIATYTKNLQMQLAEKDIPQVQKILGTDLNSTVLMGRGNYLCQTRLRLLSQKKDSFSARLLPEIYLWAEETLNGTYEEWPFSEYPEIWPLIAADADGCHGQFCRYQEKCYLQKARRRCQQADIIVVNHHIFFSDLQLRCNEEQGFLPDYKVIIFDEAHHLEQTGIDFLGTDFSRREFVETVGEMRELLQKLQKEKKDALNFVQLFSILQGLEEEAQALFFEVNRIISSQEPRFIEPSWWQNLQNCPVRLCEKMDEVYHNIKTGEVEFSEELQVARGEICNRWKKNIQSLDYFINLPERGFVSWLEERGRNLSLRSLPLSVDDFLQKSFYPRMDSIVFTSATLSINDKGLYYARNMGLSPDRTDTLILGSPFDYDQQATLLIPREIPAPSDKDFVDCSGEYFKKIYPALGPRSLLLFTSYEMLNSFHSWIEKFCDREGIEVFVQGNNAVSRIISEFKNSSRGIILGTASFWEGIDLPGADLTSVLLFRLPFPVPSDPWINGKALELQQKGHNPFFDLMLPRALIRFKQGWGRLIRSFSDRGILIIFDRRLLTKSYGKNFLNTLPDRLPVREGEAEELLQAGIKFWDRAGEIWTEVEK